MRNRTTKGFAQFPEVGPRCLLNLPVTLYELKNLNTKNSASE